jgi:transposase InsO family protein
MGVMFRKHEDKMLLIVPKELRKRAIQMYHDTPRAGHYASKRTFIAMRNAVWWKTMEEDVKDYVDKCLVCQYYKVKKGRAPHFPRTIPPYPFYTVSMDMVGPLATTFRGNRYILVCQDAFSKWVEMVPLTNARAATVADAFMTAIVTRYGPPVKILTDRGSQFTSALFGKLCAFLGVRSILTTAYRPQSNGANERTHQELKRYLGMFMADDGTETTFQLPWDALVKYAAWAYNTTYHAVLRMTPYEVLYNRAPTTVALGVMGGEYQIAERLVRLFDGEQLGPLSGEDRELFSQIQFDQERAQTVREKVKHYLEKAQERWNPSSNPKSIKEFIPGDQVLLRNLRATANTMMPRYTGPYTVLAKKSDVTYEIARPEAHFNRQQNKDIVHVDRMKLFHEPEDQVTQPVFVQEEVEKQDDEESEKKELTIIKILDGAGDEVIAITPPMNHDPVPTIVHPMIDSMGRVQEPSTNELGAEESEVPLGLNPVEMDTSPDPDELRRTTPGYITRARAKKIGYKVPDLWRRWQKKSPVAADKVQK